MTHGVVSIPFPGTELYASLEKEGRITTKDWSKYDGSWLVFKHPNFTVEELYKGIMWYESEFNKRHIKREFKWHHQWDNHEMKNTKPIRWKTIFAIGLVVGAMVMEMPILFGLLYMLWAVLDIKSGHAYIIEDVSRKDHPVLFWIIVFLWMGSGLYIFLDELLTTWL